jgi:hypothetical protein
MHMNPAYSRGILLAQCSHYCILSQPRFLSDAPTINPSNPSHALYAQVWRVEHPHLSRCCQHLWQTCRHCSALCRCRYAHRQHCGEGAAAALYAHSPVRRACHAAPPICGWFVCVCMCVCACVCVCVYERERERERERLHHPRPLPTNHTVHLFATTAQMWLPCPSAAIL